jgi:hypothetical protein
MKPLEDRLCFGNGSVRDDYPFSGWGVNYMISFRLLHLIALVWMLRYKLDIAKWCTAIALADRKSTEH